MVEDPELEVLELLVLFEPLAPPNSAAKNPPALLELLELERSMVAWSPCFTWPTWVSSTVALTLKLLVETTTIWADDEPDAAELVEDEGLELPEPPGLAEDDADVDDAEPEEDPPEPDTCWPTERSTEATVPAIVEVSEASARSVSADVSWDWAEVTEAWSERIWLVEAPLDWSLESFASAEDKVA